MKKLTPLFALIGLIFICNDVCAQTKKQTKETHVKDSISLSHFLKELDKNPITKETLFDKKTGKPIYKTYVVYYTKDKVILSPAKSDL